MAMGSNTGDGRSAPSSNNGKALGPRAGVGNVGAGQPQSTAGKAPPFDPSKQVRTQPGSTRMNEVAGSVPPGGPSVLPPMPAASKSFKLGGGA